MNIEITQGEWRFEKSSLPTFSPNGHIVIKAGEAGTPIAILPMPLGGQEQQNKQLNNAKLIAAVPEFYKAALRTQDLINKIRNVLPEAEDVDYDPGDVIMSIESIILSVDPPVWFAIQKVKS